MAVYKKTQIAAIILAIMLLLCVLVAVLRPDILSLTKLKKGGKALIERVTGKEQAGKSSKGKKEQNVEEKYIYRLDLKSGGRVYTDNLKRSDGTFVYTTPSGMEVAIQGHRVIKLIKFKEGMEPND